ncbi:MAG: DUF1616 domain-containing protein [Candidatus Thermoplasmatota archaeon]|nr:DUF1616 domain-containing protein [Candidatus Thermoplasmatota archaeon]
MNNNTIVLAIFLLVVTSGCIHLPTINEEEDEYEKYTEFYMLGFDKKCERYPSNFNVSSVQTVYLGLTNMEGNEMSYSIEIFLNEMSESYNVDDLEYISISNHSHPIFLFDVDEGVTVELPCIFQIDEVGLFTLHFNLLIDNEKYREIQLKIQVDV